MQVILIQLYSYNFRNDLFRTLSLFLSLWCHLCRTLATYATVDLNGMCTSWIALKWICQLTLWPIICPYLISFKQWITGVYENSYYRNSAIEEQQCVWCDVWDVVAAIVVSHRIISIYTIRKMYDRILDAKGVHSAWNKIK